MSNILKVFVILVMGVFLFTENAVAVSIDGIFDRNTEWAGFYADGDGYVGPGVGGQAYDVEYLGLKFDSQYVYFGLQTGFDLVNGRVSGGVPLDPGDFALDVNNNGIYDYAIDFSISGSSVTYSVYENVVWEGPYYPQHSIAGPFQIDFTSNDPSKNNLVGNGTGAFDIVGVSYVIEGIFDISLLSLYTGDPMKIHWTMECGNDYLDQTSAPVPEPASMFLLGWGLFGVATVGRRRFFKRE